MLLYYIILLYVIKSPLKFIHAVVLWVFLLPMELKIQTYLRSDVTIPLLQSAVTILNCNYQYQLSPHFLSFFIYFVTQGSLNASVVVTSVLCHVLFTKSTRFPLTCFHGLGSGVRPSCFQEHGCQEGPGKMMRLTKGVSISLPSSPLLPRQADIIPSQSCIRFTGG